MIIFGIIGCLIFAGVLISYGLGKNSFKSPTMILLIIANILCVISALFTVEDVLLMGFLVALHLSLSVYWAYYLFVNKETS